MNNIMRVFIYFGVKPDGMVYFIGEHNLYGFVYSMGCDQLLVGFTGRDFFKG